MDDWGCRHVWKQRFLFADAPHVKLWNHKSNNVNKNCPGKGFRAPLQNVSAILYRTLDSNLGNTPEQINPLKMGIEPPTSVVRSTQCANQTPDRPLGRYRCWLELRWPTYTSKCGVANGFADSPRNNQLPSDDSMGIATPRGPLGFAGLTHVQ